MKLLLPIEAVFDYEPILRDLSDLLDDSNPFLELRERGLILEDKLGDVSDYDEFKNGMKEYIRSKDYGEEVKNAVKYQEALEDPFPLFLTAMFSSVMMFLKEQLPKILTNNIDEIQVIFPAKLKTDFENHSKYSFKELLSSMEWMLDFMPEAIADGNSFGRILLVVFQFAQKFKKLFKHLLSIVFQKEGSTDDEIFRKLFEFQTLYLLNLNLDPAFFQAYEFSGYEVNQISKIRFNLYESADAKKKKFREDLNEIGEEIYYFVEHIEELREIIDPVNKIMGLSYSMEYFYKREYIEIDKKLKSLINLEEADDRYVDLKIEFCSALDPRLSGLVATLIKKKEKYFCAVCKDTYIIHRIEAYFSSILGNNFKRISAIEALQAGSLGHNYLRIDGIDELSSDKFQRLWAKLNQRVFRDGFVIFTASKLPVNIDDPNDFAAHEWLFDSKLIDNNFSKIFHSMVSEKSIKLKVTESILGNINHNKYRKLFPSEKIDLRLLHDAIASQLGSMNFDYNSVSSWYLIINDYQEKIAELTKTEDNRAERNVIFNFDGKQWLIDGITDEILEVPNLKGVIYLVLALLYNQKYGKGIEYQHLATISDFYGKQIIPKRRTSLSKNNRNSKFDSHSKTIRYGERINNAFKTIESHQSDSEDLKYFNKFIQEHIKSKSNCVWYTESKDSNYHFAVNGNLKIDERLFGDNYLDILKKTQQ